MNDFLYNVTTGDIVYDCETYPNAFTIGFHHRKTGEKWLFEISSRKDQTKEFCYFLELLNFNSCTIVGFNNIGFDYPIIHRIYANRYNLYTFEDIYLHSQQIINAYGNAKFGLMVYQDDWIVNQLDLFKIHHFDNKSKSTSLKVLEFNMRLDDVEDLPFDVGTILTNEQIDALIHYMWHDIYATDQFMNRTLSKINLRKRLSETFDIDMMNMSDIKMGETILVSEMEKNGISCYDRVGRKKVKRQTKRKTIDLNEVIFPYINFENFEFQRVKTYFESRVITETKGVFNDLIAEVEGLEYKFGTGGLHMSTESKTVVSDDHSQLIDVDVKSFYPLMGIKNKLFPAHLGVAFCDAYEGVYITRTTFEKGTSENEAFKLALVGAYGGSNNEYSPFLDSKYTMAITINGQLLLCMLVEQLIKIPELKMIQANTDGVTFLCPRNYIPYSRKVCKWWEQATMLELEEQFYDRMFIRDVNNYIAEKEDKGLKRIGVYAHVTADQNPGSRELPHHKDWSARIVPLAAEAVLVRGEDAEQFIRNYKDDYDFLLRTKVPRSSQLELAGERVSNTIRYYMSVNGGMLEKVMPSKGENGEYKRANKLTDGYFNEIMNEIGQGVWDERIHTKNKSTYSIRRSGIHAGCKVSVCNNIEHYDRSVLDYQWYINEVNKITKPIME